MTRVVEPIPKIRCNCPTFGDCKDSEFTKMKAQPLISHPPLLPGESLLSLLARLAKCNNYEPRGILFALLREWGIFKTSGRLGSPSQVSQFRSLETLTSTAAYDLHKATAHAFTAILTPPENEVEYLELAHALTVPILPKGVVAMQIRSEDACQFCPLCLKSAAFHRLIWLPIACAVCLEHKCLLVNACPQCGARIRIRDVVEVVCPKCKTDLAEVEAVSVGNDSFGLFTQSVIQSWLIKGVSPLSPIYPLPQQMPRELYRVVDGMRLSVMLVNQDWPLLHRPEILQHPLVQLPGIRARTFTPYQSYCLYATACKGIINWPHGFHLFLSAYRERGKKSRLRNNVIFNGTRDGLGRLYLARIHKSWNHPTLEFVQEAFNQYLIDNQTSFSSATRLARFTHTPQLTERLPYMSVREAAKLLEVTSKRLKFMIRSGQLMTYQENGNQKGKRYITLLKRDDVLELHDKWRHAMGLQEVMNWLGLSRETVLDLVQIGLLAAQQSHTEGYFWSFTRSSVAECIERVVGKTHTYTCEENESGEKMLSLIEAYKLMHFKLKRGGIAFILQEVTEGRLLAFSPKSQRPHLGTLKFFRSDIDAYVEAVKAERDLIGVREVARILEISKNSIRVWVRAGLISPAVVHNKIQYFDKRAIVELKADIVLRIDAPAILRVTKTALDALISQGRIQAIRGPKVDGIHYYVFSRKSLLQWRSTRVTLEEASQFLQVSKKMIINWVKQGKLLPLENEAQKPWYFSPQALHALGQDP